jgi:hypothetical protein
VPSGVDRRQLGSVHAGRSSISQLHTEPGDLILLIPAWQNVKVQIDFRVYDDVSEQMSFHRNIGSRNGAMHHSITVDCVRIKDIIDERSPSRHSQSHLFFESRDADPHIAHPRSVEAETDVAYRADWQCPPEGEPL